MARRTVAERFWSKVDRSAPGDGCWPWTASRNDARGGYGRFNIGGKIEKASRVAYELTHGELPDDVLVRHTCDNPPCCRPSHLLPGSNLDNATDAVERGRTRRNERHPHARLTDEQVADIRRLYAAGGVSQRELGERFGVWQTHISHIVRGARRLPTN